MTRFTRLLAGAALAALASTVGLVATAAPASAADTWSQVSTSRDLTCAVRTDASLWCSGFNGILSYGSTDKRFVRVGANIFWSSVSVGGYGVCAISTVGYGYCWGSNNYGQLGVGNTTNYLTPKAIAFSGKLLSIANGGTHACAIDTWNDLYCWGDGREGGLGVNSDTSYNYPQYVGAGWSSVSAGDFSNCALATDARAYCWGGNYYGELGLGVDDWEIWEPTEISGGGQWISIDTGGGHSCGVTSSHRMYCWGLNNNGELGAGYPNATNSPVRVGSTSSWGAVSVDGYRSTGDPDSFTCGLYANGTRFCWGDNYYGQLGVGGTTDRHGPIRILNEGAWSQIAVGSRSACGLRTDATLQCWGHNGSHELGLGDTVDRSYPTTVG